MEERRRSLRGIYAIVDRDATPDPVRLLEAVLRAGIRTVQYRAKSGVERDVVAALHARTQVVGATLIVNDDFEAALLADGWHAGQEDIAGTDLRALRVRLGARLFGISCGDADEARQAEAAGADYVGSGPYAATGSKADAGTAIGATGIRVVVDATGLPVVAIGGIDRGALADVVGAGAAMAAVISAIAAAKEPECAARELVDRWSDLTR